MKVYELIYEPEDEGYITIHISLEKSSLEAFIQSVKDYDSMLDNELSYDGLDEYAWDEMYENRREWHEAHPLGKFEHDILYDSGFYDLNDFGYKSWADNLRIKEHELYRTDS